jgi:hypothetical protein
MFPSCSDVTSSENSRSATDHTGKGEIQSSVAKRASQVRKGAQEASSEQFGEGLQAGTIASQGNEENPQWRPERPTSAEESPGTEAGAGGRFDRH